MSFVFDAWQRSDEWYSRLNEPTYTTIQQELQPLTDWRQPPDSQLNIVVPTYGQFMFTEGCTTTSSSRSQSVVLSFLANSLAHSLTLAGLIGTLGALNVCNTIINLIKLAWQLNITLNSQNPQLLVTAARPTIRLTYPHTHRIHLCTRPLLPHSHKQWYISRYDCIKYTCQWGMRFFL